MAIGQSCLIRGGRLAYGPDLRQCLVDVRDQVVRWLDSDRQADEGGWRRLALPPPAPFPGRLDAPEAGGRHDKPRCRHDGIGIGSRAVDFEREQWAESARHLPARDLSSIPHAGVMDRSDTPMPG